MSSISIKTDGVKSQSVSLRKYTSNLITVRMGVASLRYGIDSRILSRRNIGSRINSGCNSLSSLETKLQNLSDFMNNSAERYTFAERDINNKALQVGTSYIGQQLMQGRWNPLIAGGETGLASLFYMSSTNNDGTVSNDVANTKSNETEIKNGVSTSGDLFGYEGKVTKGAGFDLEKGQVGASIKAEATGYVAKGEVVATIGLLSATATGTAVNATASGEAKAILFNNGVLDPTLQVIAKAEVKGLVGEIENKFGNDQFNVRAGAEGAVGVASAEASCQLSRDGLGAKAEVGAAVFKGEVKTGFSLFGVKVDLSGEAEAISVGAKVEAGVTKESFELGGKLSFLAGLGLKLKVSW